MQIPKKSMQRIFGLQTVEIHLIETCSIFVMKHFCQFVLFQVFKIVHNCELLPTMTEGLFYKDEKREYLV